MLHCNIAHAKNSSRPINLATNLQRRPYFPLGDQVFLLFLAGAALPLVWSHRGQKMAGPIKAPAEFRSNGTGPRDEAAIHGESNYLSFAMHKCKFVAEKMQVTHYFVGTPKMNALWQAQEYARTRLGGQIFGLAAHGSHLALQHGSPLKC